MLEEKKLAALRKRAEDLSKVQREAALLRADVEALERDLNNGGANIDIADAQSKLEELQNEGKRVSKEIETLNGEFKSRLADVQSREGRFRDVKEQIMKIQLKQSESLRLEQTKQELEATLRDLDSEVNVISSQLVQLSEEISQLQSEYDSRLRINRDSLGKEQARLTQVEQLQRNYKIIDEDIQRIIKTCNDSLLSSLKVESDNLQNALKSLQEEMDKTTDKIAIYSKATSETVIQERNIRDNLKYRELESRISGLEQNMLSLSSQLGTFDRKSVSSQLQRQELRQSELMGERSGIFGELRQLEDQSGRLNKDLITDYRTIEEDYRGQFVKFNATTTAIEDLEKYAKALDQAIMQFHAHKMSEVNRIIREIWTSTYQGADIDTIEIRADQEGAGGRSYNYRVVMVKAETELDMRGRSSAGQRVLASLIIRLALAETFGQHCGVIALDEPTTNLDRDNIDSLANSLAEIIKMRSQQGNFQLVVITHDEEFVDLLGRHECADYYWRVFKDENQFSSIERQSFQGA